MVVDVVLWLAGPWIIGIPERFVVLVAVLVVDGVIGDRPRWAKIWPHPAAMVDRLAVVAARRLDRPQRGRRMRRIRGVVLVGFVLVVALMGCAALRLAGAAMAYGWLAEIAVVAAAISQRHGIEVIGEVGRNLPGRSAGAILEARTGRAVDGGDAHATARHSAEWGAWQFCERVVAPAGWYALAGLWGLVILVAVIRLHQRLGRRGERGAGFGASTVLLYDGLLWVPARLSGLLVLVASAVVGRGAMRESWTTLGEAHRHPVAAAGWPQAALAGALRLALAGPSPTPSWEGASGWLGCGTARLRDSDLRRIRMVLTSALAVHGLWIVLWSLLVLALTPGPGA